MKTAASVLGAVAALAPAVLSGGCGHAPRVSSRIAGLEQLAGEAACQGARRCAPRELAVAEAALRFAREEVKRGSLASAERHLSRAEANALAALVLSAPRICRETPSAPMERYPLSPTMPFPHPAPGGPGQASTLEYHTASGNGSGRAPGEGYGPTEPSEPRGSAQSLSSATRCCSRAPVMR